MHNDEGVLLPTAERIVQDMEAFLGSWDGYVVPVLCYESNLCIPQLGIKGQPFSDFHLGEFSRLFCRLCSGVIDNKDLHAVNFQKEPVQQWLLSNTVLVPNEKLAVRYDTQRRQFCIYVASTGTNDNGVNTNLKSWEFMATNNYGGVEEDRRFELREISTDSTLIVTHHAAENQRNIEFTADVSGISYDPVTFDEADIRDIFRSC